MITQTDFLLNFPQFVDEDVFSPSTVSFWWDYSTALLSPQRWGLLYDKGMQLLTAHNLLLSQEDGKLSGIIASKSVDAVSAGYDISSVIYKDAGIYNKTIYGVQFWKLAQIIGSKPLSVLSKTHGI